jgi:adenylate cyclase
VVEESTGYQLVGQTKEVTVLFSDLRGFTVTTEGFSASDVVTMLNRYFTHMCEIIYRHGGTVDKFMGDSIMALFGAPITRSNDIERAVCSAVEMQIRMDAFNEENVKLGLPRFYMGIGINTGEVVAGKIGSDLHSEYTVIGDEVNLTSRIEAYALRGQVLISHKTYSKLVDLVKVGDPIYVSVKGRRDQVALYELLEIGGPYNLKVPDREARRSLRAGVNMPFKFQTLEGKIVRPGIYEGRILNLSTEGMLASTVSPVEPHLNMIFRLQDNAFGDRSDDIYGRIVRVKKDAEAFMMHIEFTAISPKDRTAVQELVNQTLSGYISSA